MRRPHLIFCNFTEQDGFDRFDVITKRNQEYFVNAVCLFFIYIMATILLPNIFHYLGYANQLDNGALYPHRKGTKCAAAVCPFIILVTYDDDE